ncbi:MAG: glycosyltransferase family 4 protein [Anaerolineaceae bacterium]|nr:glycosyltransferase family 4 protein [Anaerolineaceae bacterium]
MRIACIASCMLPTSTANSIQVMKVSHALTQVSDHVCLWVPRSVETSWEKLSSHYGLTSEFEVRWLQVQRMLKRYDLAINAIRQARDWSADLVYTWMPQVAALALMRKLPVILEVHDMPTGRIGPRLFSQFVRSSEKKRLLTITHALYEKLRREYCFDLPEGQIQIAPNGTDMERYADLPEPDEARRQLGLQGGLTIGYTGHFYSGRGIDLMLKLIPLFPQANFLFVGGQPEKVLGWQALLQQNDLRNTHTTGFIENRHLPLYQAAADILLMPYERSIAGSSGGNSAEICSPMKMFDYMAAGRAIISSDLPVFHEVLNEKNAVLCPSEDPDAWMQAIADLVADPERRKKLGEQARTDAANYTWRKRAEKALEGF